MKPLWELGYFVRLQRARLKHGELSRTSLKLLRVEWQGDTAEAECDWMVRPPDVWDAGLPLDVRERNQSLQALKDAMAMREVVFSALPDVRTAKLRGYRELDATAPHLIIVGSVTREDRPAERIPSLVMRAKLCGFHFCLSDGMLEALDHPGRLLELAT